MTTAEYIEKLREALEVVNKGIEQLHDDWLEPESWNSAGCGQAAAHCLFISNQIDAALALPIPDDGPKPWPPPMPFEQDSSACLAYHSVDQIWIGVNQSRAAKGLLTDWEKDFSHYLPMPPAPGGGK